MTIDPELIRGIQLHEAGKLAEAEAIYRQFLMNHPDNGVALHQMGVLAKQTGHLEAATAYFRQAIAGKTELPQAHYNLGNILDESGNLEEAMFHFQQAIRIKPDYLDAILNFGNAWWKFRDFEKAVACYRRAIQVKPDFALAHYNLGTGLDCLRLPEESAEAYREAIRLRPEYTEAHNNLGYALKDLAMFDEAIATFRAALRIDPNCVGAHDNLVYCLHFHPEYDAKMILEEHRIWNAMHAAPLRSLIQPHVNLRDPNRVLRIGYVSPDFREHPVARFILPLLEKHDRERFTIIGYSGVRKPDRFTRLIAGHMSEFRNIAELNDHQAAQLIRDDQIDILVDLSMHMSGNRLLVFARKPAPVQVSYLAYCSTTGLETIDYRLTDPWLDPPGAGDEFYSEKSVRLPETYWCYPVHEEAPEVNALPAFESGRVTFGSLNTFCKVSAGALELWAELLKKVSGSRLILYANAGAHRDRLWEYFKQRGIDSERVNLVGRVSLADYFGSYGKIDIALDPFPCSGGTTTCDALWMGVPVVTLAGCTAVGRGGVTILNNLRLPELIADTPERYIQIACALAGDLPRLAELRKTLRALMLESPLMDGARFTRNVEAAYRQMWRTWCATINQ